jgi:hypothetical protein
VRGYQTIPREGKIFEGKDETSQIPRKMERAKENARKTRKAKEIMVPKDIGQVREARRVGEMVVLGVIG